MDQNDPLQWRGCEMIDRDGDKIGTIREIYLDADTRRPEWAIVKTSLFDRGGTFVPLAGADREGDLVRVPYEQSQVKDAPQADADGELSVRDEERLHSHYGMAGGGATRVRLERYVVEEVPAEAGTMGEREESDR